MWFVLAALTGVLIGSLTQSPPSARACPPSFQDLTNDACRVNVVAGTISVTAGTSSFTSATSVFATVTSLPNVNIASLPALGSGTATIGAVLQGTSPWVVSGNVNATIGNAASISVTANTSTNINIASVGGTSVTSANGMPVNITNAASIAVTANTATNINLASVGGTAVIFASGVPVNIVGCGSGICATTGQANMASSISVAVANNQSAIPTQATNGVIVATSIPSVTLNGARANMMGDKFGRAVIVPHGDRALATFGSVTIATTVESTLIPPAGASTYWDITSLFCSNTNASSGTRVDIRDTTAGTIRHSAWLAGNGGGFVLPLFVPFPQQNANATWTVQLSVNVTDVRCNFVAIKNQ